MQHIRPSHLPPASTYHYDCTVTPLSYSACVDVCFVLLQTRPASLVRLVHQL
jgi:hypothetical protein